MKEATFLFLFLTCAAFVSSMSTQSSLVVSSTETPKETGKERSMDSYLLYPEIYNMDITANISNRFARTLVSSKVRNSQKSAKETTFTVVLPEKAFISEFVMEIGEKSYKAYVKEKEEARREYNKAVASGQSAAHVAVSARDSNRFTVSINLEPESKAVFLLTYQELLERRNSQYELVLNIHPGQIVKRLNVEVHLNESRPLKFVKTPSLRSGNEISKNEGKLDPSSDVQITNSTTAVVKFNPDAEKQKQFARDLGGKESDGLAGQFIVQYDVERDPHGGEVLLQDGYFIHFFAPTDLKPLPKHVVFVLDTSGSMAGRKLSQLKDAMKSILDEIAKGDIINIVEFSDDVKIWDINFLNATTFEGSDVNYQEPFAKLSEKKFAAPTLATTETIRKAKSVIDRIYDTGATNIIDALLTALYLVKNGQRINTTNKKYQPIIIFLTDGQPNVGISSTEEIVKRVTKFNSANNYASIFSLSFGDGADKEFLKKLSLENQGFSRHIYEASDASLQLQEFYRQISSPLLSDVKFKYDSQVREVTKTHFPIFFRGSELVVAGKYKDISFPTSVNCWGSEGVLTLRPTNERPVTSLERLWAYLTVKQTLEKRSSVENKTELNKKALDLALKYSFVTDVTSLVVVKPNDTAAVDTEEATRDSRLEHVTGGSYLPKGAIFSSSNYNYPALSGEKGVAFRGDIGLKGDSGVVFQSRYHRLHYHRYSGDYDNYHFPPLKGDSGDVFESGRFPIHANRPTTTTTPRPPSASIIPALKTTLPWLTFALNPNGTLTIAQKAYGLGENVVLTTSVQCPKTPLSNTENGTCTLLKDCPEVHATLTHFHIYRQYFCPINNKYAGVCCPKKIR